MDKDIFDKLSGIDIPEIAKGTVVPPHMYQKMQEEEERQREMENIKQIAVDSRKQTEIMENQLELQRKEIESSKKQSKISLIISIVAILATVLSAIASPLFSVLGI